MMRTIVQCGLAGLMAFAVHVPVRADDAGETTASAHQTPIAAVEQDKQTTGVSVVASNLPLGRVLQQLESQSGVPIKMRGTAADTKVTIIIPKAQPLDQALEQLSDSNDLKLRKIETGYEVWNPLEYQKQAQKVQIYQINEARAADINRLITPLLSDKTGTCIQDDRLNTLIVYDVREKQQALAEVIKKLDQKQISRVFKVRHRRVSEMEVMLKGIIGLSSTQLWADEATRQILVNGNSMELAHAARLFDTFDIPVTAPEARPPQTGNLQR